MKPLVKWAGGKRHIAADVIARFPSDWRQGTYFEPFLGGAAIYLECQPNRAVLTDINRHLIGFYAAVKKDPHALLERLEDLAATFNALPSQDSKSEFFYKIRDDYNSAEDVLHPVYFFALNKLCFNGLYRENAKGFYNVPFGQKKVFPPIDRDHFLNVSKLLQVAELQINDFTHVLERAREGDFVYLDPPYIPESGNFTAYSADGFGLDQQKRLATLMLQLAENGVRALMSNSSNALSRDVFSALNIETINAPRMVSAKASGRGTVEEILVTNF